MNSIANIFQAISISNAKSSAELLKTSHVSLTKDLKEPQKSKSLREIPLSEVGEHDDFSDCWIVLFDRVYNVTKFLNLHPGGQDIIMEQAGRDATFAFRGTGHSKDAFEMMKDYLIGELPEHERIFRSKKDNVVTTDMPV